MAHIGYPALILDHMLGQTIVLDKFLWVLLAAFLMYSLMSVLALLFLSLFRQNIRTYFSCLSMNNVGNIGLAVCALAFGHSGVLYGIAFVVVGMIFFFVVAPGVTSGSWSVKEIVLSPAIYSVVFSIVALIFNISLPQAVMSSLNILGGMAIPLMLVTLGHSLAQIKLSDTRVGIIFAIGHVILGGTTALVLTNIFNFVGAMRGVLILQCLMPCAVSTYLWISIYRPQDSAKISGIIFLSTLMSIFILPIVLTYWVQ
ncbi:AEC family transporter [Microbulbifer sp. VAAF005]|uniref:AEC family transporter n=1 Tax=Microbulbifer sp. VAAF005 TaxID=3034230 RepID=UPI0024AD8CDB|nr:AEC family transporter [Microbulbifer sp. VAAF005]WHI46765.1 AEC family transporter [Microbulbifer sp. VAAF005]